MSARKAILCPVTSVAPRIKAVMGKEIRFPHDPVCCQSSVAIVTCMSFWILSLV